MLLSPQQGGLPTAVLALADGAIFKGNGIGATGSTVGEVVFNTSITGYQEILTDPSYCQQIVTLTYPHVGNYGTNEEDMQASRAWAAGLVIRDLPLLASNFRSTASLGDYLRQRNIVAIANVDTRRLTRHLREHGAQNGCIITLEAGQGATDAVISEAVASARKAPDMSGLDLAKVVSTDHTYEWNETTWELGRGHGRQERPQLHVVVWDFGVKFNTLRILAEKGCRVTVVPAWTTFSEVAAMQPDGVLFSNGPGDPQACDYAVQAAREAIDSGIATFGICLGHQIMALAMGAKTFKMKFGHHGANHPVKDHASGRVCITSQNHGFAVDAASLPETMRVTHTSLFDGTVQGLAHAHQPASCFQGHPEAAPGPHDIVYLFEQFVAQMRRRAAAA